MRSQNYVESMIVHLNNLRNHPKHQMTLKWEHKKI